MVCYDISLKPKNGRISLQNSDCYFERNHWEMNISISHFHFFMSYPRSFSGIGQDGILVVLWSWTLNTLNTHFSVTNHHEKDTSHVSDQDKQLVTILFRLSSISYHHISYLCNKIPIKNQTIVILFSDLPWQIPKNNRPVMYPLVNVHITMERSTIFHGKTHYFYGHFP